MSLFKSMNLEAIETGAESVFFKELTDHVNGNGPELETPDLSDFISEFTAEGEFTTPVGTVDATHLMEEIVFSTRQPAFDAIQMEALKGDSHTTMIEAAQNWMKLVKLMNEAGADFYKNNIVKDYS